MKKKNIKCGGVALFNGILFTSDIRQVQVERRNNNDIYAKVNSLYEDKRLISRLPVIRGIVGIKGQIGNAVPKFVESSGEKEKNSRAKTMAMYCILIFAIILFPILISIPFSLNVRGIIQAFVIFIEFMLYILLVYFCANSADELNRIFMYHGAEHKAVNTYEKYGESNINIEKVKKESRFHKRCGGNFVVYYIILLMLFALIPIDNLIVKTIVMLAYGIINIGVAYEVVNIFSMLAKPLDILNYPATLIQYVTTKEPDEEMLKLAIYGIKGSVRDVNGITPNEYIKKYVDEKLKEKNIEYDTRDIYTILSYITKNDINTLLLNKDKFLINLNQEIEADKLLDKYYFENYPLQYITHKQYFYNEEYYVDENVLIPRSDSEIIVEKAIEYIANENIKNVLDLCTGSGALGISVAKNSNVDFVELIDISDGALEVARKNIILNNMESKIKVLKSDLLEQKIVQINNLQEEEKDSIKVDMIISNPPYIRTDVIPSLDKNVQKEPMLALDGGITGLDYYNRIFKEAKYILKNDGILMLEIGYDQLNDIKQIINDDKEYKLLESVKDYGGNDRVVICRFQDK